MTSGTGAPTTRDGHGEAPKRTSKAAGEPRAGTRISARLKSREKKGTPAPPRASSSSRPGQQTQRHGKAGGSSTKRRRPSAKASSGTTTKKQKTSVTSKTPPSTPSGSAKRLPSVGQTVVFHALPGYVEGSVLDVLTEETTVNGKTVKATKAEPRIKIKSHGASGKICVHKPDNLHF